MLSNLSPNQEFLMLEKIKDRVGRTLMVWEASQRETHGNREEMRSRKHTDDEAVPRSRNSKSYRKY